jgi:hypothetical protein
MCHSGMPQRNAVGEAFKNNGYRLPGGGDEAFTKQKNIQIGTDEWKKQGLFTPVSASFPQFDPLSVVLTGNIISYKTNTTKNGVEVKKEELNYNAPSTAALFYGATIGEHLSVFGEIGSFGTSAAASNNVRAVYTFSPGINLALGNNFSNVSWNGVSVGGVVNVSGVLPAPGTYAELNFTRGETGGYSIVAGTSMGAKAAAIVPTENKIDDILYLRGKVKLFGAGLLSGTGGEFGNSYNGLDNQVTLGAGLSYAKNATNTATVPVGFTGGYAGETLVYGADIQGVYKDFQVGVAASRDRDLKLNNFKAEAGYFVYPWLFAKVAYSDLANSANQVAGKFSDIHQPSVAPAIAAWIAPNVSLTGTYTFFTKDKVANTNTTNQNTFALAVRAGF